MMDIMCILRSQSKSGDLLGLHNNIIYIIDTSGGTTGIVNFAHTMAKLTRYSSKIIGLLALFTLERINNRRNRCIFHKPF